MKRAKKLTKPKAEIEDKFFEKVFVCKNCNLQFSINIPIGHVVRKIYRGSWGTYEGIVTMNEEDQTSRQQIRCPCCETRSRIIEQRQEESVK